MGWRIYVGRRFNPKEQKDVLSKGDSLQTQGLCGGFEAIKNYFMVKDNLLLITNHNNPPVTFSKGDLRFWLPETFKGLSRQYMIECIFDAHIQEKWEPQVGDIIVGYTGNVFVISGEHKLDNSLGGACYFFGGSTCGRNGSGILNSTQSYVMNKDGFRFNNLDQTVSRISDFRFVPYPHEI